MNRRERVGERDKAPAARQQTGTCGSHVNHSILPVGILGIKVCIATALLSFDFVLKTFLRCSSVLELLHSLYLALGLLSRTTATKSQ